MTFLSGCTEIHVPLQALSSESTAFSYPIEEFPPLAMVEVFRGRRSDVLLTLLSQGPYLARPRPTSQPGPSRMIRSRFSNSGTRSSFLSSLNTRDCRAFRRSCRLSSGRCTERSRTIV